MSASIDKTEAVILEGIADKCRKEAREEYPWMSGEELEKHASWKAEEFVDWLWKKYTQISE